MGKDSSAFTLQSNAACANRDERADVPDLQDRLRKSRSKALSKAASGESLFLVNYWKLEFDSNLSSTMDSRVSARERGVFISAWIWGWLADAAAADNVTEHNITRSSWSAIWLIRVRSWKMLMRCLRKIQLECNLLQWELPAGEQRCGQRSPRSEAPAVPNRRALCARSGGGRPAAFSAALLPSRPQSFAPAIPGLHSLSDSASWPERTIEHELFTGRKCCLQGCLYSHGPLMFVRLGHRTVNFGSRKS